MCASDTARDRVAQIITFGKLQARAVLRDVGRVLQMPYGQVDRLCKLVPMNPANPVTLAQAIAGEPGSRRRATPSRSWPSCSISASGSRGSTAMPRPMPPAWSSPTGPLIELVPLYRDPRAQLPATQFNMKWAEAAGLVKFDFLGLKTLTVIETARRAACASGRRRSIRRSCRSTTRRPTSCWRAATRSACSSSKVRACAMRCASCKPDRFEDIIAIVALYRPGPMDNIRPTSTASTGARSSNSCIRRSSRS